jgi:hypothetical protein
VTRPTQIDYDGKTQMFFMDLDPHPAKIPTKASWFGAKAIAFGIKAFAFGAKRFAFNTKRFAFGVKAFAFKTKRFAFEIKRFAFETNQDAFGTKLFAFVAKSAAGNPADGRFRFPCQIFRNKLSKIGTKSRRKCSTTDAHGFLR